MSQITSKTLRVIAVLGVATTTLMSASTAFAEDKLPDVVLQPEPVKTVEGAVTSRIREVTKDVVRKTCSDSPPGSTWHTYRALAIATATARRNSSDLTPSALERLRALNDLLGADKIEKARLELKPAVPEDAKQFGEVRLELFRRAEARRQTVLGTLRAELMPAVDQKVTSTLGVECDDRCRADAEAQCLEPEAGRAGEGAAGALGGFGWEATVLQGATAFLRQRAEQELTLWFTEQFQDDLCDHEELFPKTCSLISTRNNIKYFPPGALFISALKADLESLPIYVLLKKQVSDANTLAVVRQLFTQMRSGDSPIELLAGLQKSDLLETACQKKALFACELRQLSAITSLLGTVLQKDVEPEQALEQVVKDYFTTREILCKGQPTCLLPADTDKPRLREFMRAVVRLQQKVAAGTQGNPGGRAQYAAEILTAFRSVLSTGLAAIPTGAETKKRWKELDTGLAALSSGLRGEVADAVREVLPLLATDEKTRLRLAVVVDVASARSPDEVQAALSSAAAPVGSWRVKREGLSFSVTAFVGAGAAREIPAEDKSKPSTSSAGLVGAVGVDIAFPMPVVKHGWTLGLMLNLIDVGQLLSTPVSPDESQEGNQKAKAVPGGEFQIAQVLAPGGFLRIGVGNTPFILGAGATVSPLLRKYEETNTANNTSTDTQLTVVRLLAFAAIDLTLIPF